MLSIITAIHNQIEVNRLFVANLQRFTHFPFELIVVDNDSKDGSGNFFRSAGATVIQNDGNYSYPHCQNQGLQIARFDVLAFLNNDIIVSPGWDQRLLAVMNHQGLEVASCCGVERLESKNITRYYRKKWSAIRNILGWFGYGTRNLQLMHRMMYGNWERSTRDRWAKFGCSVREGFVGSTVVMKRSALEKIGRWDERIYAADFDLYLRSKARSLERGDIRPVHVALGVFNHHYIRMTLRSPRPGFKDQAKLISLHAKWGKEHVAKYIKGLE